MTDKGEVTGGDDGLIERVSAVLRTPVHLDPSFDARLMAQVRSEAPRLYPVSTAQASWWRRPIEVRISPLAGLALAAGLTGIVALSTLVAPPATRVTAPVVVASAPLATDTVHVVRFVFVDPRATKVELVGDFNEWTKGATTLRPSGAPGVWEASVALPPGRHEYAFIINGSRWTPDPLATKSSDDFGTESSVIRVGSGTSTT
jgi:hypothetical protein